jgi:hypothetical protein
VGGLLVLFSVAEALLDVPDGLSLVITFALSITAASLATAGTWRTASA